MKTTLMVTQREYDAIASVPTVKQEFDNADIRLKIGERGEVTRNRQTDKPGGGGMTIGRECVLVNVSAPTITALTSGFETLMSQFPFFNQTHIQIKAYGDGSSNAYFEVWRNMSLKQNTGPIKGVPTDNWVRVVCIQWTV